MLLGIQRATQCNRSIELEIINHSFSFTKQATSTQRTMPTLAAVPSQRTTKRTAQPPSKRPPKRPATVYEPATVRVQVQPNQIVRIIDQPTNIEYTFYTFQVNIEQLPSQCDCICLSPGAYALYVPVSTLIFHLRKLQRSLFMFNSMLCN